MTSYSVGTVAFNTPGKILFCILMLGCTTGVLSLFPVAGMFFILFSSILLILSFYRLPYKLIDTPFLLFIVGTFGFGRAFSVLGVDFGVVPLFVTEIALIATLTGILVQGKVCNFSLWFPKGVLSIVFIYFILGTIYLFYGLIMNGALAFRDIPFCQYILFMFITINVFRNEERIRRLFWVIIPVCILTLLVSFNMVFNFISEDSSIGKFLIEARSFNFNLYNGLIMVFAISFFSYVRRYRLLVGSLVVISLLGNILLQVRTGWIATFVAFIFLAFVLGDEVKNVFKRYWFIVIFIIFVVVIVLNYLFPQVLSSIKEEWHGLWHWQTTTAPGANIVWRFSIWGQLIDRIMEHPFLGWGFGSQPNFLLWGKPAPAVLEIGPGSGIVPSHNHILAIIFKMGFIGLALFLFINIKIFLYGLSYLKRCKSEFNRRFLIAVLSGLVYWHSMALFFDILESPPTSIFLWILLGLVLGVVYVDKRTIA